MDDVKWETDRLILRTWKDSDRPLFASMNSDPAVMRFFPSTRTVRQSNELIDVCIAKIQDEGFSFMAVERRDTNDFIGFVGLNSYSEDLPFCPCTEIGWRLSQASWGQGFATEAAAKCLEIGFDRFGLSEVVSFTAIQNLPSRNVMKKIGMVDLHADFMHPRVPMECGLAEHCLYGITEQEWSDLALKNNGSV